MITGGVATIAVASRWLKPTAWNRPNRLCAALDSPATASYMFQSGSKYYLWNLIADEIWEIVTSMDLVGIVREIGKPRYGSLKIKRVYELEESDCD